MGAGAASNSDQTWTYTFTPSSNDESVTIDIAAGAITDAAGNDNTAAATQFLFTHDRTAPTSSIAVTGVTSGQYGTAATYSVVVTASEQLEDAPTLSLAGGSVGSGSGSGAGSKTIWTYTFTPTDNDEAVTIDANHPLAGKGFELTAELTAAPQPAAASAPPPAQLTVHAFHVLVGFKEQSEMLLGYQVEVLRTQNRGGIL